MRDEKIGWTAAGVIEELRERPTTKLAKWLKETVDAAIEEIYKVDFFEDETLSPREIKKPSAGTIKKLEEQGKQQRSEHHRFMETGAYKKTEPISELSTEHWEAQARSSAIPEQAGTRTRPTAGTSASYSVATSAMSPRRMSWRSS